MNENCQIWCGNTDGGGCFSSQSRPRPKGAEFQRSPIFGIYFCLCKHRLTQNYQIWLLTHTGTGLVLGGQSRPGLKRAGSSAPQFWEIPSIYAYRLCRRTTKFDVVWVSWAQPLLPSQESGVPALPIFWCSPVFMPTSFNAERPNSTW